MTSKIDCTNNTNILSWLAKKTEDGIARIAEAVKYAVNLGVIDANLLQPNSKLYYEKSPFASRIGTPTGDLLEENTKITRDLAEKFGIQLAKKKKPLDQGGAETSTEAVLNALFVYDPEDDIIIDKTTGDELARLKL